MSSVSSLPPRPTYCVVHLDAIRHNLELYSDLIQTPIMAVVKADGYGHGAATVSWTAIESGVEWFGVANSLEAMALRKSGITRNILILGYTPAHLAAEVINNDISMAVFDPELAAEYARTAASQNRRAKLHVKVDTGMGRLGISTAEAPGFVQSLAGLKGAQVEGIFTHFASADENDLSYSHLQLKRFHEVLDSIDAAGLRPPLVHAANSAGALYIPEARFDLVRMGIAVYGMHPSPEALLPNGARPALEWKTTVSQVRWMEPGSPISYGRIYTTRGREQIAVLPVGYADGFHRVPVKPVSVLVGGKRAPVVGRVCMDQIMVNITEIPDVKRGDEAVIIGHQGEDAITAEELASWWGTINYEVTCGIMARVPRLYEGA